ncbi:hypothetical protein GOBAR_AA35164 [Gossypium barbadense]|uniref:Uncharacterized protein n=1 Tax=Gossypium barbadense TaxID=3634 RepID=A0A2P5W346_GOSBA|nr:hypothetical protein GOBAR_AA35164 [Gossypium barbadense]
MKFGCCRKMWNDVEFKGFESGVRKDEVGAVAAVGWIYGVVVEVLGSIDVVKELAGVDDGSDDESDFEGDVNEGAEEIVGGFAGETIGVVLGVDFGD